MAKEDKASEAAAAAEQNQAIGEPKPLHKAEMVENTEGVVFRAPPGVHVRELGHIIHGTFHGVLDTKADGKKRWRVLHGCPVRGIPTAVLDKITEADPNAIAPWTPPAADQVR